MSQQPTEQARPGADRDAAKFQPPFPPSGSEDSTQAGTEALFNAAAVHTLPEHPAPSAKDEGTHRDVAEKDGGEAHGRAVKAISEEEGEDEAEESIVAGTPLDELKTPVLEKGKSAQLAPSLEVEKSQKIDSAAQADDAVKSATRTGAIDEPKDEMCEDTGAKCAADTESGAQTDPQPVLYRAKRQDTSETVRPKRSMTSIGVPGADSSSTTGQAGRARPSRPRVRTQGTGGQPAVSAMGDYGSVSLTTSPRTSFELFSTLLPSLRPWRTTNSICQCPAVRQAIHENRLSSIVHLSTLLWHVSA